MTVGVYPLPNPIIGEDGSVFGENMNNSRALSEFSGKKKAFNATQKTPTQ